MTVLAIMETRLMLRQPTWLFSLGIPLFVLVVFGLPGSATDGPPATDSQSLTGLATTAVAIALALIALYQVPTTLATYRERGVLRRLSTTPVRPAALLVVQLLLQVGSAILAGVLVMAAARFGIGVALPRNPVSFALAFALGVAALFSVGLLIAALATSGRAANGVGVLLYFPCAFLAGLMVPVALMPQVLVRIGRFTPLGAFREALQGAWAGSATDPVPLAIMAAYALVLSAAAARFFRWE